jgi:hypothetical protein
VSQYNSTLQNLLGEVRAHKPNAQAPQIQRDLNSRVRRVVEMRPYWSGLIKRKVVNVPAAYGVGGLNMTPGSPTINGVGTNWPVADLVNTTAPAVQNGNVQAGYNEITPASMNGIVNDCYLYIADGVFSEVVGVTETTATTFTASFQFLHNPGFTITSSSLAGRQLQMGSNLPIYTLYAVVSSDGSGNNTALIDSPFAGPSLTSAGYNLVQAYFTIDPLIKQFIQVWDPIQGIPLRFNITQGFLNKIDPMRTSTGSPECFADLYPSLSGSMQYEMWPYQTIPYSIPVTYAQQWPEMKRSTDRPPWFINPSIFSDGAIADALRRKELKNTDGKDPYFDPALAETFEKKFIEGAMLAASADESKLLQALESGNERYITPGGNWQQSHVGDMGQFYIGDGY